jgi:peptidoglycan/xylan/chitin deacetylase (PgdA/CDA1 family)
MGNIKKHIFLKSIITIVIALFVLAGYAQTKSSSVVPVLMYHSFKVEEDKLIPCVDPKIFAYQMEFLSKNNYNVVGPDKAVAYMTKKEKMPPKTVMITADDGRMSFYENAYPVLKKYNLPATIFVIIDHIGKPDYLGWNELREMSDSGLIKIGSHTKSHPWLPSVSVDEAKLYDELADSKEVLEKHLGKKVDYLCYPNGGFNDAVKEAAKKYGYKGAFTTNPSKRSSINDIYAIRRLKMSSSSKSPLVLWGKINRCYAWFKERR